MFISLEALTQALLSSVSYEEFRVKALKLALRGAEEIHFSYTLQEGDNTGGISLDEIETQYINPLKDALFKLSQAGTTQPIGEHHE